MMKRIIFALATILVVFVTLFAVLVLHPVRTAKAQYGCSDRTVKGSYGFSGFGFYEGSPASVTGLLSFDGEGNLAGTRIHTVQAGIPSAELTFSGASYDVSSDCHIHAFDTAVGLVAHGTVVDAEGGSELITDLESSGSNVTATLEIKKVKGWGRD
jgi:hypothetical protein